MSTTYNFDGLPRLEQSREELLECIAFAKSFNETMMETAKATGAAQLIKNAEETKECVEAVIKTLEDFAGQDGDNLSGNGTLMGAIESAKKAQRAFGGE